MTIVCDSAVDSWFVTLVFVLKNHDYIYTNMMQSYKLVAMRLHTQVLLSGV